MLKVLDLFSGIGGFSLGLDRAGMHTRAFCEIDPYFQKILHKHWPDVPIFQDIHTLNYEKFPCSIDVISGGFPCQPFSVAGKRRGAQDNRALWPQMFRIIKEYKPKWIIAENVTGFINMELQQMLSDLESENYTTENYIIPACAVDASHRRDRLFVIAHNNRYGLRNESEHELMCEKKTKLTNNGKTQFMANTNMPWQLQPPQKRHKIWDRASDCCRWEPEPRVDRVANGVPHRVDRLRGLGNAVVPQIVEIIGRAIIDREGL